MHTNAAAFYLQFNVKLAYDYYQLITNHNQLNHGILFRILYPKHNNMKYFILIVFVVIGCLSTSASIGQAVYGSVKKDKKLTKQTHKVSTKEFIANRPVASKKKKTRLIGS